MTTLDSAPSISPSRRRVPLAWIAIPAAAALLLLALLVRGTFKPDLLKIPPDWTGADLWTEFDLVLDDGRPLRPGDRVPSGTRATLVRVAPPAPVDSATGPSPAPPSLAAQPTPSRSAMPPAGPPVGPPGGPPVGPPASTSTAQTEPEAPLQLLCFGTFDVNAWTVTAEPRERVRRAGNRGWSLGGLNEGTIVTFHAEGPHSLVLASYADRRYSTRWLEFTVVPALDPSDPAAP